MIKGSIQQEDIMFINIYAVKIRAAKYVQQILTNMKVEVDKNQNDIRELQ